MSKIKAVVFDFDGVLTKGGEELKEKAWEFLAIPWSVQDKKWLEEARRKYGQGKGSRFEILKYAICQFGHTQDFNEALIPAYAECYDHLVQKMLVQSGLADDAEEVLSLLWRQGFQLNVNSATPTPGLIHSLKSFRLDGLFRLILGYHPCGKVSNLQTIAGSASHSQSGRLTPETMVFVGDGEGDWKAAKKFGCHFIGVANSWNGWEKNRPKGMPKSCLITSLRGLLDKIVLLEKK